MKNIMLLAVIFCAALLQSATSEKVAVTKCCHGYYSVLFDTCEDEYEAEPSGYDDWTPPVYSHLDNGAIVTSADDLLLKYALPQCPNGDIARVVTDFHFYDNGSLVSMYGRMEPEEFCLDQMDLLEGNPQFVARFCTADPCGTTNCVRKCCPHGMVVNSMEKICQFHPSELVPVIRNENGSAVDGSDVLILDGARAPICANGRFLIRPEMDLEDEFYVLASGQLRIPAFAYNESFILDYCIDRFLFGNDTVR